MHQWIRSALVQIMTCRLFDAKPLSKSTLGYCQLGHWEQTSMEYEPKYKFVIHENAFENVASEMAAILYMGNWVYWECPFVVQEYVQKVGLLDGKIFVKRLMQISKAFNKCFPTEWSEFILCYFPSNMTLFTWCSTEQNVVYLLYVATVYSL